MMSCREFAKLVGGYADGTLDEETNALVRAHMRECPSCEMMGREILGTAQVLRAAPRYSAPPGFEARLRERIAAQRAVPDAAESLMERLRSVRFRIGSRYRLSLAPMLASVLLCALVATSLLTTVRHPNQVAAGTDYDWSYIETCTKQHNAFVATSPIDDEAAAMLRDRTAYTMSDL